MDTMDTENLMMCEKETLVSMIEHLKEEIESERECMDLEPHIEIDKLKEEVTKLNKDRDLCFKELEKQEKLIEENEKLKEENEFMKIFIANEVLKKARES